MVTWNWLKDRFLSSPCLNMRQLGVTAWLANHLVYGLSIQTFQGEKASLKDRVSFYSGKITKIQGVDLAVFL